MYNTLESLIKDASVNKVHLDGFLSSSSHCFLVKSTMEEIVSQNHEYEYCARILSSFSVLYWELCSRKEEDISTFLGIKHYDLTLHEEILKISDDIVKHLDKNINKLKRQNSKYQLIIDALFYFKEDVSTYILKTYLKEILVKLLMDNYEYVNKKKEKIVEKKKENGDDIAFVFGKTQFLLNLYTEIISGDLKNSYDIDYENFTKQIDFYVDKIKSCPIKDNNMIYFVAANLTSGKTITKTAKDIGKARGVVRRLYKTGVRMISLLIFGCSCL